MALEIQQRLTQDLRLTQELVMTPQLQQAIKLLQLTRMELIDKVQEEMEENPLLEEAREEETPEAEVLAERQADAGMSPDPGKPEEEPPAIDWDQFLTQYDLSSPSDRPLEIPEERASLESFVAPEQTLQDHLLWQLRLSELGPEEQEVGVVIIGNVDEQGYLQSDIPEIAQFTGKPQEMVARVLECIQDFDPTGVASRDLRECLLRQAIEADSDEIVIQIIDQGMRHLETKNFKKLAKELGLEFEQVVEAARRISEFDPRPGRAFSSERVDYVVPDVYVVKQGGEYVVQLNEEGIPRLRVSPYYRSLLQNDTEDGKAAKSYIQERMQAALWLIKSINQRQQTLFKVATSIVRFQREFLDLGVAHLRPLILKDVAEDIEMHESTVSRVTTGKYMHTPQGTFELKYFFSSAIQRTDGDDLASRSVKARIREIVGREDPRNPLSDIQIAELLSKEFSLRIARRTVSKYRESMGVLPSSSRRSYF